jgi:lactoylglutathione lyase
MLNKVCVLTIKVQDMKSALEFYTKVLDFEISKEYGEKIVSLVHKEIPIVLEESDSNYASSNQVLPAILSENLDEDMAQLKSKGAKFLFDEPRPCPPGRFSVLEDPSGNQLELIEFSNFK